MFRDILDYQVQNADFNKIYQSSYNVNDIRNRFKNCKLNKNYFGKGHFLVDEYNRKKEEDEFENKFRNTKYKIKLVVYRNGFILNNGEFRDRSFKENNEFLKSVERGNIPKELIRKGINDLGILLINRKEELHSSKLYKSLPASFDYINISLNSNSNSTHVLDQFFQRNAEARNKKDNFFYSTNSERIHKRYRLNEIEKRTNNLYEDLGVKLFIPFSGNGKLLGTANVEGLVVKKNVKNSFDKSKPICTINIRLFNGEIIKETFNCKQILTDIYLFVGKVTDSNNFVLLDGFPPKTLTEFDKTIEDLKLENSLLTQKICN